MSQYLSAHEVPPNFPATPKAAMLAPAVRPTTISAFEVITALDEFDCRSQPLICAIGFLVEAQRNNDHTYDLWRKYMMPPKLEAPPAMVLLGLAFAEHRAVLGELTDSLRRLAVPAGAR